ncbi:tetratricopeptide repeat protein [Lolliginicoccus suaedae]|uniref:tetratricopeptide repeat protein n=1 Tax=Lolliginicoccus suaedae TaxID=2605429 RepID=UPI0016597949|nr:tetratricopeptide repeat protein [Lolliginicoccus suaedae]
MPATVDAAELPIEIRRDLTALDKPSAELVARHLVRATQLMDEDPQLALEHARAARRRASRIAVVREAAGVAAYTVGEWAEALNELRTARRIGGSNALLPMMADCERGLGRPERAIELARSAEARSLDPDAAVELMIVVSGARMDLGQHDAAVVSLQGRILDTLVDGPSAARLRYAYAEALLAAGRVDEAIQWFMKSAESDNEETDAEERAIEIAAERPIDD